MLWPEVPRILSENIVSYDYYFIMREIYLRFTPYQNEAENKKNIRVHAKSNHHCRNDDKIGFTMLQTMKDKTNRLSFGCCVSFILLSHPTK